MFGMGVQNTLVGLLMSDTWVFPTDSELEDLLRNGVTCSILRDLE